MDNINNSLAVLKKKYSYLFTGAELLNMKLDAIPYLWDGIIASQGLTALTGSSDVGKSSFLRQFAIAVALKKPEFLGITLNVRHGRSIYFSTEDNQVSINALLKKQLGSNFNSSDLKGLGYIFNSDNPLSVIEEQLKAEKTDLVIIDAYSDIFMGSSNDNGSVRRFLNEYEKLTQKYDCAIVILHHTGKRTELLLPSKNNIIGSQGFEAKMRLVMELRKSDLSNKRQLWFTKGNYLPETRKNKAMELSFNDKQEFECTGNYIEKHNGINSGKFSSKEKDNIMLQVRKFQKKGLSIDQIKKDLLEMDFSQVPSKGTLHNWIKGEKDSQSLEKVE